MNRADKILGCILGGAIGDCLGGPYEGSVTPIKIADHYQWMLSDDTQLTLATCEAIAKQGRVDPSVIADTFATWFKSSRITGIGAATYIALSELTQGGHWALVGMEGEMAAGNGAAMRIAPLAFCLDPKDPKARIIIRDVSRITHHNEEAYVGALAVALAIRAAWEGTWDGDTTLINSVVEHLPDSSVRDRLIKLARVSDSVSLAEIGKEYGCSGYVVESVPLALCGAQRLRALGFVGVLKGLISAGGDTDTIASMAGQVAGAVMGQEGLPQNLIERLPDLDEITLIAKEFSDTLVKA